MDFPIAFTQDEGEAGIESDIDFAVTKKPKTKISLNRWLKEIETKKGKNSKKVGVWRAWKHIWRQP